MTLSQFAAEGPNHCTPVTSGRGHPAPPKAASVRHRAGPGLTHLVAGLPTAVAAGPGVDVAYLYGASSGSNTLEAAPTYSYLYGSGYFNEAIGFHTAKLLLDRGDEVIGLDNLSEYYDVTLKKARLAQLMPRNGFHFVKANLEDRAAIDKVFARTGWRRAVVKPLTGASGYSVELVTREGIARSVSRLSSAPGLQQS